MQKTLWFFSDRFRLHGILHLPEVKNPPVVIGSHGLLSTGDSPKQIALAEACVRQNMAYFRYDHRGCGQSEGDFAAATTFDGQCRDLVCAARFLRDLPEIGKSFALFGSSFGGAVSLAMAKKIRPAAIVTLAAPLSSAGIKDPYVNDPANLPLVESLNRNALLFDIRNQISRISRLLIFHGDADPIVPFENALELHEKAAPPKRLVRQMNGDHPMSNPAHQAEFMELTVAWFETYFQDV